MAEPRTLAMRDVFIEGLAARMADDDSIYFLSADFGAPALDAVREKYADRFINVGIAEQNLISVATGLALEGYVVYAYGIAPFLSMRCYEQIRINLALLAQTRPLNVNLISVGAGISYDVSGPTHHCIEDLSIIRTLPNITVFSPSDWVLAKRCVEYSVRVCQPKYLRFDGKLLPGLYDEAQLEEFDKGFAELALGDQVCLVSTGYVTHQALRMRDALRARGVTVGVIDVYLLRPLDESAFAAALARYKTVLTMEEGFVGKGGLDSLVTTLASRHGLPVRCQGFGFSDTYHFENGDRRSLQQLYGFDEDLIMASAVDACKGITRVVTP